MRFAYSSHAERIGGRDEMQQVVSTANLKAIAASSSDTAKTNALVNAANEIDRLRAALAIATGGAA